jgi:hypothetical protein
LPLTFVRHVYDMQASMGLVGLAEERCETYAYRPAVPSAAAMTACLKGFAEGMRLLRQALDEAARQGVCVCHIKMSMDARTY